MVGNACLPCPGVWRVSQASPYITKMGQEPLSVAILELFVVRPYHGRTNLAALRSLFHHRDECGFNGAQAGDDRLWIVEIALFR